MKLIIFCLVFLVSSCSIKTNEEQLYLNYFHYKNSVHKDNLLQISPDIFSQNLLTKLNINETHVSEQLLFKKYMSKQIAHFEKIDGLVGCLSINGLDNESMPMSFNIKYIYEHDRWLIDEIGILFVNSTIDFKQSAQCPSEYQN
ncbi:hypothetical protein HNW13_016720 [Shewanella sp. BF02_Schw]|jgi:hypothetical protein|uniref:hypothetical protein n=2 Tax=Shewanella TaxID=22 RepID=UPI00177AF543|nr:hypothetical protein [Shewanella sp. BF02_Schw]MBO1897381.1 hypothetical protein [Shewanella sp. BF02_Schw]